MARVLAGAELAATTGPVVALGSGAVTHSREAIDEARAAGTLVVHLDVGLAQAAPRAGLVGAQPLGLGAPRALMARFAAERRPLYEGVADVTIDAGALDLDAVVAEVLRAVAAH